jgi:hypothetical protein
LIGTWDFFRKLVGTLRIETLALDEVFLPLYEQLKGRWRGCDWPTRFGTAGLDLAGVTSRQAALLARATSGREAVDWHGAAEWLAKIEADAEAANQAAWQAQQEASAGHLSEALGHAQRACDLERLYHAEAVWDSLRDAIRHRLILVG